MVSELRTHHLKCWPKPFAECRAGVKPFSIRKNDRDFKVGDLVVKEEWHNFAKAYTGEVLPPRPITCIREGFGLEEGFVVLGFGNGVSGWMPGMMDLQAEVDQLKHEARLRGAFLYRLAEALGVKDEKEGGVAEERMLQAVAELKQLAGPDARARHAKALDLTRDARDFMLLGSAPRAKEAMAEACVVLLQLVEGGA